MMTIIHNGHVKGGGGVDGWGLGGRKEKQV